MNKKIAMILFAIVLIVFIAITILVIVNKDDEEKIVKLDVVDKISEKMNNKETFVLYLSDGYEQYSEEIEDYLTKYEKEKNIEVIKFNVNSSKEKYNNLKEILKMDENIYNPPMIIYIKDGDINAYILNVLKEKQVSSFLNSI